MAPCCGFLAHLTRTRPGQLSAGGWREGSEARFCTATVHVREESCHLMCLIPHGHRDIAATWHAHSQKSDHSWKTSALFCVFTAQNTTKRARGGTVVRNEQVAGVGRSVGRAGRRGAPSRQSPGRYDRAPPPPFAARSPVPRPWTTSASCTAIRRRTCAQACARQELAREAPCCARMRAPRARKSPTPGCNRSVRLFWWR